MSTIPEYPAPRELTGCRSKRMRASAHLGKRFPWMGRDWLVVRVGGSSATLAEVGGERRCRLTW